MRNLHINKTLIGVAIALYLLAVPINALAYNKTFSDLKPGDNHYESIMELTDQGIINGKPDGSYGVYEPLQRQHAARLIFEALDKEVPSDAKNILNKYYSDKDKILYDEEVAALTPDVFNGDGQFHPDSPLSREQMASIIVRAFDLKDNGTHTAINLNNVNRDHKRSVKILSQHGLTKLTKDFMPVSTTTRGQFASFLYRALNPDGSQTEPPENQKPEDPPKPEKPEKEEQYVEEHYNIKFGTVVDKQMTAAPQTDSVGKWYNAGEDLVAYYLNPNNFEKNTPQYYQFLVLSKSAGLSATEINEYILKGKGILEGTGESFIEAGKQQKINEIYLIAHALLETGHGTSELSNGIKVNGKTTYNMFGIGANDSCPKSCGSRYAYEKGWFSPQAAILGGARFINNGYIGAGKDTLYKMRWNPAGLIEKQYPNGQYATDVGWAVKQTKVMDEVFKLYNSIDKQITSFEVPMYNNQPGSTDRPYGEAEFALNTFDKGKIYVTTTALNLREAPSTAYDKITTLPKGTQVETLGSNSGWYKIKAQEYTGWVSDAYLTTPYQLKVVLPDYLKSTYIRPKSNNSSGYITAVYEGDIVTGIVDKNDNYIIKDGYYKVWYKGNEGWIYSGHVKEQ